MLSWGWNSHRNTSNSDYGKFDFGTARMRNPANGYELRQGNNTSYIHQTPGNYGYHTPACPHSQQHFSHNHQPGCQHWNPNQQAQEQTAPSFTVQYGHDAAAAALGGNVELQGQSQYYTPESPYVSEAGGNFPLNYSITVGDTVGENGNPSASQVPSTIELGKKASQQQLAKNPSLTQGLAMNSSPKFMEAGDSTTVCPANGGNTLQNQCCMPEEGTCVSQKGPNEQIDSKVEAEAQIPTQTQSALELGKKSSEPQIKKMPMKKGGYMSSTPKFTAKIGDTVPARALIGNVRDQSQYCIKKRIPLKTGALNTSESASATNFQASQKKVNPNDSRFKLCGRCPKCKILKVPDDEPVTVTFQKNNIIGRSQKMLNQNFMNLEGKNFKATGHR